MLTFYSTKRAIIDLLIIKEQVLRAYMRESKYKVILDFIYAKDYLNDDNLSIPTMKEMANSTGIKYPKLRKLIKELYDRIFDNDELDFKFEFGKIEVIFFFHYFENYAQIKFKKLTYLPKVGDQIDFSFVNAKVGTSMFYVNRIEHTFGDNTQKIYITLRPGYYNSYLHYRRQKAIEEREIDRKDYYSMSDYQLKEELQIGRYR
jgi:hypothetical protein